MGRPFEMLYSKILNAKLRMSSESSKPPYLKRDEIVGKSVVSGDGAIMGNAADLVASSDGKVGLKVESKSEASGEIIILPEEIQAIGEVILLKPKAQIQSSWSVTRQIVPPPFPGIASQSKSCGRCGYLNGPTSKFCIKCGNSLQ
jgi:sporulation protein YlmC with PRC-barrel domain